MNPSFLWKEGDIMFENKIEITQDYIDLIVAKRKEHNLTAYQLSEKIGKNKSWLPNIENRRTKNISRDDLILLFKDFAKEENLSVEEYIIKYLRPNLLMNILEQRLAAKKRDLENQQEYFRIDMKNIEQSNYEDNAINALLCMKKLKTEIAELELVMQLKKANEI